MPGARMLRAGWRDSCEGAFYFSPTNGRLLIATGHDFTQLSVMRRGDRRARTRPGEGSPLAGRDHGISGHDVLRKLCDGHGCWRRDSPHALTFRPTNGRQDPWAKDFAGGEEFPHFEKCRFPRDHRSYGVFRSS